MYIYMCVCVSVCLCVRLQRLSSQEIESETKVRTLNDAVCDLHCAKALGKAMNLSPHLWVNSGTD